MILFLHEYVIVLSFSWHEKLGQLVPFPISVSVTAFHTFIPLPPHWLYMLVSISCAYCTLTTNFPSMNQNKRPKRTSFPCVQLTQFKILAVSAWFIYYRFLNFSSICNNAQIIRNPRMHRKAQLQGMYSSNYQNPGTLTKIFIPVTCSSQVCY